MKAPGPTVSEPPRQPPTLHPDLGVVARPPKPPAAAAPAKKSGHAFVVIDSTLVPADRLAADRPFYSGKHRRHGMSFKPARSLDEKHSVSCGLRLP
jgi:hypothetical protein